MAQLGYQQLEPKEEEIPVTDVEVPRGTEKRILESLFSKVVTDVVTGFLYSDRETVTGGKVLEKSLGV